MAIRMSVSRKIVSFAKCRSMTRNMNSDGSLGGFTSGFTDLPNWGETMNSFNLDDSGCRKGVFAGKVCSPGNTISNPWSKAWVENFLSSGGFCPHAISVMRSRIETDNMYLQSGNNADMIFKTLGFQ